MLMKTRPSQAVLIQGWLTLLRDTKSAGIDPLVYLDAAKDISSVDARKTPEEKAELLSLLDAVHAAWLAETNSPASPSASAPTLPPKDSAPYADHPEGQHRASPSPPDASSDRFAGMVLIGKVGSLFDTPRRSTPACLC